MKASNRFNNTINANKNKIKTNKTPIKNKKAFKNRNTEDKLELIKKKIDEL